MRAYLIDKDKEYLIEMISWVTGKDRISNVCIYIDGNHIVVFNEKEAPKNEIHIIDPPYNHHIANLQKSIEWRKE